MFLFCCLLEAMCLRCVGGFVLLWILIGLDCLGWFVVFVCYGFGFVLFDLIVWVGLGLLVWGFTWVL